MEPLPVPAKAIKPGEKYAGAAALGRRLVLLGDLPADAAPAANADVYGGALVEGVKRFQGRHGLDADGQLGPGTVKQLNVPIADRVRQLQFALERWRWLPSEFSAPPIVVNIPDFQLRAADAKGNVAMTMRVVVGKAAPTQTPVFSRDMTYVVFRPYWNVPPSILRGEIVPAITRDRNYIAKKNYEVTTPDGKVVTDGPISDDVLAQLKAGKLAVRQKPGPANALGLVKLIFPNEFNVYLHSTPSQALFAKSRRDFSHGCIRVEKPAELAAWALRNNPDWTLERVRAAMQTGPDNVTVKLERPVPVFIVYATALAYENGEVHFYDDIYGHDADLAQALAKGYPYPVELSGPRPRGPTSAGRVRRRRARSRKRRSTRLRRDPDAARHREAPRSARPARGCRSPSPACACCAARRRARSAAGTRSWPACDNRRSPGSRRRAARGKPAGRGADPEGAGRTRGRRPCASRAGLDRPGSALRDRSQPRSGTRRRDAPRCGDGGSAGGTSLRPRAPRRRRREPARRARR